MEKIHQYFAPGTKVVRVAGPITGNVRHPQGSPKRGLVYVVSDCWDAGDGYYLVAIVGFQQLYTESGQRMGWPSWDFRRVSEVGHPAIADAEAEPAEMS